MGYNQNGLNIISTLSLTPDTSYLMDPLVEQFAICQINAGLI